MKKVFLLLCVALVFSCTESDDSGSNQGTTGGGTTGGGTTGGTGGGTTFTVPEVTATGFDLSDSDTTGWDMIWEEDFSSNLSDWSVWQGGAFNNELQLYQDDNLYIENGYLFIRQRRQVASGPTNPYDGTTSTFAFTSGRIETNAIYSPATVDGGDTIRYSARILLPEGEGLWPAFWSYNDPWPTMGEIDVIEYRGGEPNEYSTNFHYGEETNTVLTNPGAQNFTYNNGTSLSDEFHVFEVIWSQNALELLFDGNIVKTYNTEDWEYVDDMYDKSQKIVLNMAVGGNFFTDLDETQIPNESFLIVDWVKVFKQ